MSTALYIAKFDKNNMKIKQLSKFSLLFVSAPEISLRSSCNFLDYFPFDYAILFN